MKPLDPKKIQASRSVVNHPRPRIHHIYMVYPEDTCVPEGVTCVRVGVAIVGKHHDVTTRCPRVDDILVATDVVRRIVDPEKLVLIHAVGFEEDEVVVTSRR